ncbi:MAG: EAL domain-containing protein [Proteobacteria bacterium]|nr:EAL domain-containing protein [Pseudomonadota bacterium]NOG60979.1 EAL domain-containing protein [Pseudomonadota bacterium]
MKDETNVNSHTELLNSIGSAAFVIDSNNKVIFWSRSCETLTGLKSETVLNTNKHWMGFYSKERPCLADMVLDEDWEDKVYLYNNIKRAPSTERGLVASNWCQTSGGLKFLIFEANALFDDDNNITGVIETLSDATELKKMEEELQILSRAVEHSSSAVFITNSESIVEFVNPRFCENTGYSNKEIVGKHINVIRQSDDEKLKEIEDSLQETGEWQGEIRSVRKDGSYYWDRCSLSKVKNSDDHVLHLVGVQDDVTFEYEAVQKLNYDASHDALTGLVNRRGFEINANKLIRNENINNIKHSLCFIDLDQFKIVNDTCGHEAGDELLRRISKIFIDNVRKNDTLARLGGDEFVILMENCDIEHSHRVASNLLKLIQNFHFSWEGETFKVGLSIGIVVFDESTTDLIELMRQADSACYVAKDMGRNRIQIYAPDDSELNKRHSEIKWVTRIPKALNEDSFYLDAQSIESLSDKNELHYELLIRLCGDNGEGILPNVFLPSAERFNYISAIDEWVIKKSLTLLAENPGFLDQIKFISINLSGQSLANEKLGDFISNQLSETGVDGKKICFEITETSAIKNLNTATNLIHHLKKYGCSFAIDDFGSGLSSYAYLKNLPVDYLKIDGLFVKDIVNDPIDYALVKSINEVGHILNVKTIAEFVENHETKGMLKAIGVDYVQGYGIAKPVNFEKLLIRSNNTNELNAKIV